MKIVAFIDASLYARSVIDHTAWLARNRPASIELVQIVSPNELMAEQVTTVGPSASIALDHERVEAKVGELERAGRCQLDAARNRLAAAGLPDVTARLIHGNIAASMLEVTRSASIAVMGKRGENADLARLSLGSQVERLVRSAPIPVLAVSRSFRPIERMLLAMNAGDTLAVDALAAGALPPADLQLLHVGDASGTIKATLQQAA
ncbi:MAG: universal stress protein, partial [Hyphomicrobiales bacterium]